MDRLISERAVIKSIEYFQMNPQRFDFVDLIDDIKEIPSVEVITKSDYENRLKTDMVAMLEEFDLRLSEYEDADLIRVEYIRQDIEEKINALKVESEE